jgi:SAM-dependent methyltransferase
MNKPESLTNPAPSPVHFTDMQLAAARQLRWYPSHISVSHDKVSMDGWALSLWDRQDQYRFMINGVDFDSVEWPLPSQDLVAYFPDIPHAAMSRFRCSRKRGHGSWPFENGFARFNVTSQFGEHVQSYKTAWYLADPDLESAMPSPAQMIRVIGTSDTDAYRSSGATLACRFSEFLKHQLNRPIESFDAILDWGCGAGRLTRYMIMMSPHVTGVDIDADNIGMCAEHLLQAKFLPIDRHPPTPFAENSFDLIVGISVFTHLSEANQHAWLAELKRITRPGGVLLMTISGQAQMHLYQDWGNNKQAMHHTGIHALGQNSQLRDVLADPDYYVNAQHSHDYVFATWQKYFDVIDIAPALGIGQDVVVLRARQD